MAGEIRNSVNGLQTLCGGTRTTVKVDRPWQPKMVFPTPNPCPFCTKKQEDEYTYHPEDYFHCKTFQNSNTPFPYHRLLIPAVCWDEWTLRNLGGEDILKMMLSCALQEVKRTKEKFYPVWIFTHIGSGAGQNLTHNHWHLLAPPTDPKIFLKYDALGLIVSGEDILWRSWRLTVAVSGVRAGQTFIGPTRPKVNGIRTLSARDVLENPSLFSELMEETYKLVMLFNDKFLNPDYCLLLALNSEDDWHIRYTPILNNWGGSEFAALDYGTPFVLPWPHSETVKFLKS